MNITILPQYPVFGLEQAKAKEPCQHHRLYWQRWLNPLACLIRRYPKQQHSKASAVVLAPFGQAGTQLNHQGKQGGG